MPLNPEPRRALTSREIANILSGLAGVFAVDTEPAEVMAAFEHFIQFKDAHLQTWKILHQPKTDLRLK